MTAVVVKPYQVNAVNDALSSENRIHSDDIARKYGFTGALVSGVSVFAYLAHPLVEAYGEDWLSHTQAEVKFLKPAYVDDLLSVTSESAAKTAANRHHITQVRNQAGAPLAELASWRPDVLPAENSLARRRPADSNPPRAEINWDRIIVDRTAESYTFRQTIAEHLAKLDLLREDIPLFRQGEQPPLHPYTLLKECNHALMRLFILPAWIHVGSTMTFRRLLRAAEDIEVRTVPIHKWERKGHQFIKLYVAMLLDDEVALEVEHTAIFRIAAQE